MRDARLVKPPYQLNASPTLTLQAFTEDHTPELYSEFLEKVSNGEVIEVAREEKEEVKVECGFLDAITVEA
jgi:hypothetical protein